MADISNLYGSNGLVATTPGAGGYGPGLPGLPNGGAGGMGGLDLASILRMKAAADAANDEREIAREGRARQYARGSIMTGREPTMHPDFVRMNDRLNKQQDTRLGLDAQRQQHQQSRRQQFEDMNENTQRDEQDMAPLMAGAYGGLTGALSHKARMQGNDVYTALSGSGGHSDTYRNPQGQGQRQSHVPSESAHDVIARMVKAGISPTYANLAVGGGGRY